MNANELMIGNYVEFENQLHQVIGITKDEINLSRKSDSGKSNITYWVGIYSVKPILLSKYWCADLSYSVISESSAGFRYGFVINHIFSSDLNFVLWKTTKNEGKFFRGDLQLKCVHKLQNLHFSLTSNPLQLVEPK